MSQDEARQLVEAVRAVPVPPVACEVCGDECQQDRNGCGEGPRGDYVHDALWRASLGWHLTYRDRWVMQQLMEACHAHRARPAVQLGLFADTPAPSAAGVRGA